MADILPPSPTDAPFGSYNWQDWYIKVRNAINAAAAISWSQITDFTGSNLTQLVTRSHQSLQNILGTTSPNTAFGHVPVGGAVGQVLSKVSATDYDYSWAAGINVVSVQGNNSGAITLSSVTSVAIGAGLSATIPAVVGDHLEIEFTGNINSSATTGTSFLDMRFNVNGTDIPGFIFLGVIGQPSGTPSTTFILRTIRTVVSGDLTGGNFIVQPFYSLLGGAAPTLFNNGNYIGLLTVKKY